MKRLAAILLVCCAGALSGQSIKTVNDLAISSVKTVNGLAIGAVKTINDASNYIGGTFVADGTSDHVRLTSDAPTGLSDSITAFTISMWIHPDANDGTQRTLFHLTTGANGMRLIVELTTGNDLHLSARDGTPTVVLDIVANDQDILVGGSTDGWYHIFIAIDLTNSSNHHIYVDGAEDTSTPGTYNTAGVIDSVGTGYLYTVCATGAGAADFPGAVSEFLFNDAYDATLANYVTSGKPKDLGATGTGAVFFLHGSGNACNVNTGTGGNLTVTGTFGTTTPP